MKTRITLVLIILLYYFIAHSQTISTSQGSFKLIPVTNLADATAAKSAKRTAEIAITAVVNDANAIQKNREALEPKVSKYNKDLKDYDIDLMLYNARLKGYNESLTLYDSDLDSYKASKAPYDAELNAYNSKKNRTQEEYNNLLKWKSQLDAWYNKLEGKKAVLNQELNRLNSHKSNLESKHANLESKRLSILDQINQYNFKFQKAYEQLEVLKKYADECNKILTEWKEPVLNTYNLNTALEKLKALASKGWN